MKQGPGFFPTEIIFSVTDSCNLHCPHCFVNRRKNSLDPEKCLKFLSSCPETIEKIGFTGGEPFLNSDFLCQIIKYAVEKGLMFDRIMTNGIWWKDHEHLNTELKKIYDAGFDGKIGLSWDTFHNQNFEKIMSFCNAVLELFGPDSLEIQTVIPKEVNKKDFQNLKDIQNLKNFATELNLDSTPYISRKGTGQVILQSDGEDEKNIYIPVYIFLPSLQSENPSAWNSKKWFKEDFCQGPGNILYIHADGNIAPCCGFSNENPALFSGNINQTYDEVIKKASENPLIKICYETGLSSMIKQFKKSGVKLPGKTYDICTFCDFAAKHMDNI